MRARNPLREALQAGRFCYVVELVASRISREAQLLEIATQLGQIPGVVAGSVTSYAGGAPGHDPLRVGVAARARGLVPNIHITCVSKDRRELGGLLEDLNALSIENVFALTGDYPRGTPPVFDMDSVELVTLINQYRQAGMPFWISVAVSPFKYTEADCGYQYLKLEKKLAAGADYAITQLGFDARKFRELRRYLDEKGISKPVLGNVYVLNKRGAEKMAKGEPPGCWVAPELVERIRQESLARDRGEGARLERAAKMVAIVKGLGYAGAYIGGTHKTEQIKWIIDRSEALAPRWEELAEEFSYAPKNGYYMYESPAPPRKSLPVIPRTLNLLGRMFPVRQDTPLRRILVSIFEWIDRRPRLAQNFERLEFAMKSPMFGCQACGNCVLGDMEYVCPQTCPKQLRNGPCGGTDNGQCEVIPEQPCIWVKVYDRAKAANELDLLKVYIPPPDRSLKGTSSYINYFLKRDSRPGRDVDNPGPPLPPSSPEEKNESKVVITQKF